MYSVFRTLQFVAVPKRLKKLYIELFREEVPSLEQLDQIQQIIESLYEQEIIENEKFKEVLQFIREKGITENFLFEELEELAESVDTEFFFD